MGEGVGLRKFVVSLRVKNHRLCPTLGWPGLSATIKVELHTKIKKKKTLPGLFLSTLFSESEKNSN